MGRQIKFNKKKKNIKLNLLDVPSQNNQKDLQITESELPFKNIYNNISNAHTETSREIKSLDSKNIFSYEDVFKTITSNITINKILISDIEKFVLSKIPDNKLLMTNIHIYKKCFNPINKDNDMKVFNYEMEIISNNNILIIGKIVKNSTNLKIKLFITYNHIEYKYIGKIVSNIIRNEFNVYIGEKKAYKKILKIKYALNIFGLFGIRIMKVETINENNITEYKNKLPIFSKKFQKYFMDFNQRVRLSSKRNFILENNNGKKVIQCGKIDKNTYALDFEILSPIQAFSITITSLINKIFCE